MTKRKICIVTGTRAEYGLLSLLMKLIKDDINLELSIIATGSHLSPEFGLTYKEIEDDGFKIDKKIEMVLSADTPSAITKSTGLGMIGFADVFADIQPDIIVLLGDRYEMLSASFAALSARIPVAHIHGGEITAGAFDESIRHSITKMSWWHFAAAEDYKKRIIQLGEDPERIFNVGGLGVDLIMNSQLLTKEELINKTGINFTPKNLLVTYHPVTLENQSSKDQLESLLNVLAEMNDINLIFTMPNADLDGRGIFNMITKFVSNYSDRAIAFKSMGYLNYLSTIEAIISELMPYFIQPLSTTSKFLVFLTEFNIGFISKGLSDLKSITSAFTLNDFNILAVLSDSIDIYELDTIVISFPLCIIFDFPIGTL